MSDSILFLALATIFGAAMLLVGWEFAWEVIERRMVQKRVERDYPDPVDSAGA